MKLTLCIAFALILLPNIVCSKVGHRDNKSFQNLASQFFDGEIRKQEPKRWCYDVFDYRCGPRVWELLPDIDGNVCGGNEQSPIELFTIPQEECQPANYVFSAGNCKYKDIAFTIDDHSIEAVYPETCTRPTVRIGNEEYEAEQFHIHISSEHSLDGNYYSLEVHIVHNYIGTNRDAEELAVIGYFVDAGTGEGEVFPLFETILPNFIETASTTYDNCGFTYNDPFGIAYTGDNSENILDPYFALPAFPTFYQYNGGLTTPPCTEDVFWSVLSEPVRASIRQVFNIVRLVTEYVDPETCMYGTGADPISGGTSRPPVDPLGREIRLVGACEGGRFDES